jgi:hypothetical protein
MLKKTKAGNYFGYYKGHYVFTYKRPHGKWSCRIGKKGEWLWFEGYHSTYLTSLAEAEIWVKSKLNK